jgi:hypothetical protein
MKQYLQIRCQRFILLFMKKHDSIQSWLNQALVSDLSLIDCTYGSISSTTLLPASNKDAPLGVTIVLPS